MIHLHQCTLMVSLNVVPLTRNSVVTTCQLPDDTSLAISCFQVEVLLNFTMRDYVSQGKTWQNNVVDLTYSCSHQGYYTAISRGVSAASTLILNSFHSSKITGGASGALWQEFRELELLDNVTTRHFEGKLLRNIAMANCRNTVITLFCEHKGLQYMPSTIHSALRWSKCDLYLEWEDDNLDWRIVEAKPKKKCQAKQQPESSYTKKLELAHVLKRTLSLDLCQPHCL